VPLSVDDEGWVPREGSGAKRPGRPFAIFFLDTAARASAAAMTKLNENHATRATETHSQKDMGAG
jgi:hypothetical protein